MSETQAVMTGQGREPRVRSVRSTLAALEIDMRLLGMIAATAVIWIGFQIATGGTFLSQRNLWNLSVQSASVGIMATGMVLVIVSRNIDLSVGSVLGFTGMTMALLQVEWIPQGLGLGLNQPYTWIIVLGIGLALGAVIGAIQGFVIAYVGVPSFIVTLGGLLIWRGCAWLLASGRTIAPMDNTFALMGGGPKGSVGELVSWFIGLLACGVIVYSLWMGRRRRVKFGFPVRPAWAEATIGIVGCAIALGAIWIANTYYWPEALAAEYAAEHGITPPPGGLQIPVGIANPVLIAIVVTILMTILANRRRFGRAVYAYGGNPDAAELAGINTRRTVMKIFILMGILAAVSGAVSIARLNAAVVGLGVQDELAVISAAVIGGTSFAGGIGTVPGALLGAVIMQSLVSGMILLNIDAPLQDVVVGVVLVAAVAVDQISRKRVSR